jgi:osmoprotectant transport system ATP-binding protein
MDEPFGAIDPIARERLQNEFRAILRRVRKTVVLVTHDLDEAIRLGDWIAIMRSGKIVQHDSPEHVLSHPADDFVASFVGVDRAIKRLSLFSVRDAMTVGASEPAPADLVHPDVTLKDALAIMIGRNTDTLVVGENGRATGRLTREALLSV